MGSGRLRHLESVNFPFPLSRAPRFFFSVCAIGSNNDATEATTAEPWRAAFSTTASFVKPTAVHKNHHSAFAPRGPRDILRPAQVS